MSASEQLNGLDVASYISESQITLELTLAEAEALRGWLLTATVSGASCLDEPLVNQVTTELAHRLDTARATASIRRELEEAGLDVSHLSDEHVRSLARRVSEAARQGLGD